MKKLLILIAAVLLIGCNAEKRCARNAKRCAPLWQHDTTFIHDSIRIERTKVDTFMSWLTLPIHDTITLRDERLTLRFVKLPGDSFWMQGECGDTVIRYVKQTITVTSPKRYYPRWYNVLLSIAGVWIFIAGWWLSRRVAI
jgi:hypothetical protein